MDETLSEKGNPISSGDHVPPPAAGEPPLRRRGRFATLLRVGLSVVVIVVLMLWIFGAFRGGVIQAGKKPVPEESAANLAT
jgi:hypothetical protein